jgi:hypothetical protein
MRHVEGHDVVDGGHEGMTAEDRRDPGPYRRNRVPESSAMLRDADKHLRLAHQKLLQVVRRPSVLQ